MESSLFPQKSSQRQICGGFGCEAGSAAGITSLPAGHSQGIPHSFPMEFCTPGCCGAFRAPRDLSLLHFPLPMVPLSAIGLHPGGISSARNLFRCFEVGYFFFCFCWWGFFWIFLKVFFILKYLNTPLVKPLLSRLRACALSSALN